MRLIYGCGDSGHKGRLGLAISASHRPLSMTAAAPTMDWTCSFCVVLVVIDNGKEVSGMENQMSRGSLVSFVRPRRSCAYVIIANKFHYIPWIDYIIIAWAGLTRVE